MIARTRLEPVHQTVGDACPPSPRVDIGTLLAGPHVPDSGLVPQVAHLRFVATGWSVLETFQKTSVVTAKDFRFSPPYYGWDLGVGDASSS